MTNEQLFLAEAVADFLKNSDYLTERDMRTVSTLRHEYVCKDSPIGEYKCYVEIKFTPQSGAKDIYVDTCLQDEVYALIKKRGIRTLGCCCGHGIKTPYIQVDEHDVEDMLMMGYKPLPTDENGNGKWCFKPKTFLNFCEKGKLERSDDEPVR